MGILLEHLRSCAAAPWNTFGMYTAFVTLNPCPLNAHLLYKMAGHDYTFQADGCPATGGWCLHDDAVVASM